MITDLLYISNHEYVNSTIWPARQDLRVHSAVSGTFLLRVGVELITLENTTLDEAIAKCNSLTNGSSAKVLIMMRLSIV